MAASLKHANVWLTFLVVLLSWLVFYQRTQLTWAPVPFLVLPVVVTIWANMPEPHATEKLARLAIGVNLLTCLVFMILAFLS